MTERKNSDLDPEPRREQDSSGRTGVQPTYYLYVLGEGQLLSSSPLQPLSVVQTSGSIPLDHESGRVPSRSHRMCMGQKWEHLLPEGDANTWPWTLLPHVEVHLPHIKV